MQPVEVERLATLCKVWGTVKLYHPWLAYREIDWDAALIEVIPEVRAADSDQAFRAAIDRLLSKLGDPATHLTDGSNDDGTGWEAMGEPISRENGTLIVRAGAFGDEEQAKLYRALITAFQDEALDGVVLDLRRCKWQGESLLRQTIGELLTKDLFFPGTRARLHSGFRSAGWSSGGYYSAWTVEDAASIKAVRQGSQPPLVVISGRGSDGIEPPLWAAALQRSVGARAITIGKITNGASPSSSLRVGGLDLQMTFGEYVWPDGSVGFEPDARADTDDDALALARESVKKPSSSQVYETVSSYVAAPRSPEFDVTDHFPREAERLYALFWYWTVIEHFFPYHHLLDRPWGDALTTFIPRIAEATDAAGYHLALAEMSTWMQDTHAGIGSEPFGEFIGTHLPALRIRTIEGRPTVVGAAEGSTISVGDVILAIDGVPVEDRRSLLARYAAVSTPQALRWRTDRVLLAGPEGDASLELERADGTVAPVQIARSLSFPELAALAEHPLPAFCMLEDGIGYFDLDQLFPGQVDEAFDMVQDSSALIIDIRCYPNGTAWPIGERLAKERTQVASFTRPETRDPKREWDSRLDGKQFFEPRGTRYEGFVVCLIDERAISQSEHSCLIFESLADAVFIGSPTNGANGDVTAFQLPGGIWARFTGHDVRHADGRQLQRVGVQPHVLVEPTIAGIRAGRDEVLEAAIGYIRNALA